MISIYVHIPFCVKKCDYCAFYSISSNDEEYERYTNALIAQIKSFPNRESVKTIYFGGGTPSLIGAKRIIKILNQIKSTFDTSLCEEITVEVNPKTTSLADLILLKQNGVNRLSIGLQSTNNELLDLIGRIHTYEEFLETFHNAKEAVFENISVDIIYGLPYQTLSDHIASLEKVVMLDVQHISVYGLTIEPNTRMFQFRDSYTFPDEDEEFEMYLSTSVFLEKNSFSHYEISNFSKKGFESKHNSGYWEGREYIGFGPSAHSFYKSKRFSCEMSVGDFINFSNKTDSFFAYTNYESQSVLSDEERREEKIMLMLRMREGIELSGSQIKNAERFVKAGYMIVNNNKYSMTPAGWYISNTIISNILME